MKTTTLISWVGMNDLDGITKQPAQGSLHATLAARVFQEAYLLYNYSEDKVQPYLEQLRATFPNVKLHPSKATLTSPIHYGDIHAAFENLMSQLDLENRELTIQLSSGTPAMAAVSILLGKSKYGAKFLQASAQQGVIDENLPFDIAAEFLPSIAQHQDKTLISLSEAKAPSTAAFENIITQDTAMQKLINRAALIAQRDVPILIYGETGTGKELFAQAIKNSSTRANKPFKTINCGALSPELLDATLFGHTKGAYTGAANARKGYFEECDGGTLFLDEFGELTLEAQVRLLRVIQEGKFTPLGSTQELTTDVRIITATHKNLPEEIAEGRFREDLFYRIAIGVLNLPPLRERQGDLILLAEHSLKQQNDRSAHLPGAIDKKLSPGAKKLMLQHGWPGNVRELQATLMRASLWREGETITEQDMSEALLLREPPNNDLLNKPLTEGFDLEALLDDISRHYIQRAMNESNQIKTKAAEKLGFNNYQTLNNWIKKVN